MPDKSKNKELKRVKQLTGSYCGPAVFEMLVSGLGVDLNQESMIDSCNVRASVMKVGVPLAVLSHGLKRLYPDLRVWMKNEGTIEDISVLLENGYFVAVDWQGVFNADEYHDDVNESIWEKYKDKLVKTPILTGDQGHYCIVLEVNTKKGYLRFADPYGHYVGKDRFIAIWEFEERWWDDRMVVDEAGKKVRVVENKLMFIVTQKEDVRPVELGMMEV
jgi:hypothetical protein